MFSIDLRYVISSLVNDYLKEVDPMPIQFNKDSITRNGIYIEIRLNADDFDTNKRISESYYVLFCGNVSVFYAKAVDANGKYALCPSQVPVKNWVNTSNHDSCWRSDGLNFLTSIYFDYCDRINPNIAPKDVNTSAYLGFGKIIKNVTIQYKRGESYRKEVIKVEP